MGKEKTLKRILENQGGPGGFMRKAQAGMMDEAEARLELRVR